MFEGKKRVLFIGAHPDDIEVGAGGTLLRFLPKHDILCCTFSRNVEKKGQERLPDEHHKSMRMLGVPKKSVRLFDFRTRYFDAARQEICDLLWQIREEFGPDIVITHTGADIHQDHNTIFTEAKRAFRDKTLLGFEVHRSHDNFHPTLFIEISREHLARKHAALACYETHKRRNYLQKRAVEALAIARAVQMERPYVEAFEIIRVII